MQELIYMKDAYCKECDAKVLELRDTKTVILDNVIFYPQGGGVPYDKGKIIRKSDGEVYNVVSVRKIEGVVAIDVDKDGLKTQDEVHCVLDWERRYKLMRMHTAAHILASIFYNEGKAYITGNQIDVDKSRFDFSMQQFDREKMNVYVRKANEKIMENIEVKIYEMPSEEALKIDGIVKLAGARPPNVKMLRIVEIPGVDIQADGGLHVRSTGEIGKIEVIKLDNKGADNKRVYFVLN